MSPKVLGGGRGVGMARAPVDPGATLVSGSWPHRWSDRSRLLERQHDRLAALLTELLLVHAPEHPAFDDAQAEACELVCRRLLWDLQLHLRLEERWLAAAGALCPGHLAAHREVRRRAKAGFVHSTGDRLARQQWLLDLQTWFLGHRQGPDAIAYGRAAALDNHSY